MKNEFRRGFISNIPIGISVFVYGTVLGMMCIQKGIGLFELVLMDLFVFAGSAQFVMVNMWSPSLDVLSVIMAALMINLRYFLIGISLNPLFINRSKKDKFKYMHLVADENWAITINKLKDEKITPIFLFGGGICILLTWTSGTIFGYEIGSFINNPEKYALDYAFISIFTALTISMYKGKSSIIPWLITGIIALTTKEHLPGNLYIVIAAITGSLSAVIFHKEKENA